MPKLVRVVFRVAVPSHDSLTTWLPPLARRLREALDERAILLAFDRAGAFSEALDQRQLVLQVSDN